VVSAQARGRAALLLKSVLWPPQPNVRKLAGRNLDGPATQLSKREATSPLPLTVQAQLEVTWLAPTASCPNPSQQHLPRLRPPSPAATPSLDGCCSALRRERRRLGGGLLRGGHRLPLRPAAPPPPRARPLRRLRPRRAPRPRLPRRRQLACGLGRGRGQPRLAVRGKDSPSDYPSPPTRIAPVFRKAPNFFGCVEHWNQCARECSRAGRMVTDSARVLEFHYGVWSVFGAAISAGNLACEL
jgi:hypothetical protein